jgi:hypothetical protein
MVCGMSAQETARGGATLPRYREHNRRWRAANPEKCRERDRRRRAADPEKFREQARRRYAANLKKSREQQRQRRAANLDTELILFGVRGKNNFLETRKRDHSRKPDEIYPIIEACSPGPFLERFARGSARPGWVVWGDEAAIDCDFVKEEACHD